MKNNRLAYSNQLNIRLGIVLLGTCMILSCQSNTEPKNEKVKDPIGINSNVSKSAAKDLDPENTFEIFKDKLESITLFDANEGDDNLLNSDGDEPPKLNDFRFEKYLEGDGSIEDFSGYKFECKVKNLSNAAVALCDSFSHQSRILTTFSNPETGSKVLVQWSDRGEILKFNGVIQRRFYTDFIEPEINGVFAMNRKTYMICTYKYEDGENKRLIYNLYEWLGLELNLLDSMIATMKAGDKTFGHGFSYAVQKDGILLKKHKLNYDNPQNPHYKDSSLGALIKTKQHLF